MNLFRALLSSKGFVLPRTLGILAALANLAAAHAATTPVAAPALTAVVTQEPASGFVVGVQSSSFLSKSFQTQSHYELGFIGETNPSSDSLSLSLDALSSVGLGCTSCSFVEVKELLIRSTPVTSNAYALHIGVGRRHLGWSEVEERWKLGLLDPRFRNDELNPMSSALAGVFIDQSIGPMQLSLFASTLYVPERGSNVEDDAGKLSSDSPWFVEPPKEVIFLDQSTPIRYHPNIPPVAKIVRQNSLGASLASPLWTGARASVFAMNKPSNQLALSYDATLDLSTLVSRVDLYPRVMQQSVWGFDFDQKIGKSQIHFGILGERFTELNSGFAQGSTTQVFQPALVYGLDVSRHFEPQPRMGVTVGASLLSVVKQPDQEVGPMAQPSGESIFSDRFLFQQAMQLTAATEFSLFHARRDAKVSASYTRDIKFSSQMASYEGLWQANRELSVSLRLDFLAANTEKDGFVGQFRSNDRILGGVRYVF